ncbi:MAG TPA: OmpH family outer membrane protein [Chitinophagaceae bacterium]|jgi:outer membrane protein|nr:OmpH family outer membrane protein [Chitinophagaceae bacterium]HMU59062.1 OmpH family outer membrane protein [Chitinophagaceae bacterium]
MKNGLIIWNVVLTLIAGYLLFNQFGGKNSKRVAKAATSDSLSVGRPVKIAYFEMDSVATGFVLVKNLKADLTRMETDIETSVAGATKNLQEKYNYYQNLDKEGKLTPEQAQGAAQELKKMEDDINSMRSRKEQDYMDFKARRQNDIKKKIEDFIKEFNKNRGYTFVLSDDPGLFYYRDTTYNITKEVVKGLNETHKNEKK